MTLPELRRFVAASREREGVNWYLFDSTPVLSECDQVFILLCYDDGGRIVRQVAGIAEQAGGIPFDVMQAIADARTAAGVNNYFLRRAMRKIGGRNAFYEARHRWLEQGRQAFLDAHAPTLTAL